MLTPAEWRVADAVRHGMSNRAIAGRQGVSIDAVKYHVANALMKLGMSSRAELRAWDGVPMDSALKTKPLGETAMSQSLQLGAIGQISRSVSDIDRAVEWYGKTLGLPHLYTFGDLAFFDCGGTRLFLGASDEGRKVPGESVIYFQVEDIHATYEELRERGVEFSGAPHMVHRHENGVEEWLAFFPDPEGNLLALISHTS